MKKITILVAVRDGEDQKQIVSTLSSQDDLQIAGIENDETGAIIKSERLKPDVLILDLQSSKSSICSGIDEADIAPMIHRRSPGTAIIMLSDNDNNEFANKALRAGIAGFMLRNIDMDKLLPAVNIVHLGGYYISASITQRALDKFTLLRQFPGQVMDFNLGRSKLSLTTTERGIVEDIARGYSDKEIAKHLNFSIGTIRNYLSAIKHKTKLKNRIQIVIYSLVTGIISFDHLGFDRDSEDFEEDSVPLAVSSMAS